MIQLQEQEKWKTSNKMDVLEEIPQTKMDLCEQHKFHIKYSHLSIKTYTNIPDTTYGKFKNNYRVCDN